MIIRCCESAFCVAEAGLKGHLFNKVMFKKFPFCLISQPEKALFEQSRQYLKLVKKDLEAGFGKVVVISNIASHQNEIRNKAYRSIEWTLQSGVEFKLLREFL